MWSQGSPRAADVQQDKAQKPALCVSTEARPVCEDSLIFEDDLPLPLSDMASLEPRGVA